MDLYSIRRGMVSGVFLSAHSKLIDGVEESVSVDHSSFCAKQSGKRAVGAARVRAR